MTQILRRLVELDDWGTVEDGYHRRSPSNLPSEKRKKEKDSSGLVIIET